MMEPAQWMKELSVCEDHRKTQQDDSGDFPLCECAKTHFAEITAATAQFSQENIDRLGEVARNAEVQRRISEERARMLRIELKTQDRHLGDLRVALERAENKLLKSNQKLKKSEKDLVSPTVPRFTRLPDPPPTGKTFRCNQGCVYSHDERRWIKISTACKSNHSEGWSK